MQDKDRADELAKAIEEMVQGRLPGDPGDEELRELLQIAKIRLDVAKLAAEAGTNAQDEVLKRLLTRLDSLQRQQDNEADEAAVSDHPATIPPGDEGTDTLDISEFRDVIGLRRRMAEGAAAISETHRDAVWQRVQARIAAERSERRGFFPWPFRRRDREAEEFGAALDRVILGEPIWEAKDSRLEGLLRVAHARRAAAVAASAGFADQQARVWSHLRPRIMAKLGRPRSRAGRSAGAQWRKLAAAGAAAALALAALGPLPATGLSHHPVTELARFVGGHIGVTETSAPPAVPPVTEVVDSNAVSAAEAGELLGLPVYEPIFLPDGYASVSSRYFPEAITAESGGVFVLAFEGTTPATDAHEIVIYQERASSRGIAVVQGSAQDITLLGTGIAATYINGTWEPLGTGLAWGEGAQTVVFDHAGLRTTVRVSDGDMSIGDIQAIADGLARQAVSPTS